MKIIAVDVFVTCPGRNFVTLKITTESGLCGLGDATLNGRELSVASYLKDHLCPQLIGRDASRIEDIWQFFYKGAYWRRGPVTMSAISAIDMALWDIKAKAANMPLYQLLGGASREGVMVYCHTTWRTIDEVLKTMQSTSRWALRRFVCSAVYRVCKLLMAWRRAKAWRMNRQPKACGQKSSCGLQKSISILRRSYLKRCVISSVLTNIWCMTCTIA